MAIGKADVGGRLYVHTTNDGQQVRNSCVIDAHGEQTLRNNTFSVRAGRKIYFYVRHGSPQIFNNGQVRFENDPGSDFAYTNALKAIATGVARHREEIDGSGSVDDCYDYNLSKIQRSMGGCCGGAWSNFWGERNDMSYDDIESFIGHFHASRDIVTIRHRRFKQDITLSEVIALLDSHGYNYSAIHCSFCRNPQLNLFATKSPQRVKGAERPRGH